MLTAVEKFCLIVIDVQVLRLHCVERLREWRRTFIAHRDEAIRLYDERFCRMREFYLASRDTAFRAGRLTVFQVQLAKSIDALPLTRSYMIDTERMPSFVGAKTWPPSPASPAARHKTTTDAR